MVTARHGHCMAGVNQTRPHCVNQMGKMYTKPLAARHGMGTEWSRHGHGMLCVNRPLEHSVVYAILACTQQRVSKTRVIVHVLVFR